LTKQRANRSAGSSDEAGREPMPDSAATASPATFSAVRDEPPCLDRFGGPSQGANRPVLRVGPICNIALDLLITRVTCRFVTRVTKAVNQ
jgi:hypothetical protein